MKRALMVIGTACCLSVGAVAVSAATGTPEIDRANATISLKGRFTSRQCIGEDGIGYVSILGSWAGSETDVAATGPPPPFTDYSLTGTLSVTGINWTINTATGRGLLTGGISLTDAAGTTTYKGSLTLITQGVPAAGATVPARGWIVAGFAPPDDGVTPPNDDRLLANVEFAIATPGAPTLTATGQFGDVPGGGSLGFPDFSIVTNLRADGTC